MEHGVFLSDTQTKGQYCEGRKYILGRKNFTWTLQGKSYNESVLFLIEPFNSYKFNADGRTVKCEQ